MNVKVNFTVEMTQQQVAQFLAGGSQTNRVKVDIQAPSPSPRKEDKGSAPVFSPGELKEFLNKTQGRTGPALTDAGLAAVWDLHKQGFGSRAIAAAFQGRLHHTSVSRVIRAVKNASRP